jgi:cell division protein FtsI (penicillin-binding protein 3)
MSESAPPDLVPEMTPPPPRPSGRRANIVSLLVMFAISMAMLVMLGRVVQLQVRPSDKLRAAMDQRVTTIRQPGARGDLQDRKGRTLAATHFGRRVFVDPWNFPTPPGDAFQKLAEAIGMPIEKVAERLVPALDKNDQLRSDASVPRNESGVPDGASRYLSLGGVLDDALVQTVRAAKIPGVGLEYRSVRETPADGAAASLIGLVGIDHNGLLGAEFLLDREMTSQSGSISYVRDAASRPLWIAPGGYVAPKRGSDVRLSIDIELQSMAYEELMHGIEAADAAGGRLVMMDPITGEVLAMVDIMREMKGLAEFPWRNPKEDKSLGSGRRYRTLLHDDKRELHPAAGRNRCVEDVYEPGSTFKPFMWSVVTEMGLAGTGEVFDTENGHWTPYGRRHLEDVIKRPTMTWSEVLVNSSNIGMAKGTSRLSFQQMHDAVRRFGFGSQTKLGLPGESPGIVTKMKSWSKYTQTSVAMGHEVAVTPIQMVRAFSAFARTGDLAGTMPSARLLALDASEEGTDPGTRVLPVKIANLTRTTMRGVTQKIDDRIMKKDENKAESAAGPKYEWFGKSGTAEIPLGRAPKGKVRPIGADGYYPDQYNSSFLAGAPVDNPKIVVVVVIDDPGPALIAKREHYGSHVAGPVAKRVIERALPYLGVAGAPVPAAVPEPVAQAN